MLPPLLLRLLLLWCQPCLNPGLLGLRLLLRPGQAQQLQAGRCVSNSSQVRCVSGTADLSIHCVGGSKP